MFVREALRRLDGMGPMAVPKDLDRALPAVEVDWVRHALEGLSRECSDYLGVAATAGRAFSVRLVSEIAEVDRERALDYLDEAVAAGVLENDPEQPADYRFAHDLFREAAYDGLSPGRRARWHYLIAESLSRRHSRDPDAVVAEVAYHGHRSLALGGADLCFSAASRAAELAAASRAYEQAAIHWRQALAALEQLETDDPSRRLQVLIGLGEASRLAGDPARRREHFGEAIDLARSLEADHAFATAALGLCDIAEWGVRDDIAQRALVEALERVGESESELEARILTRLGYLESIPNRKEAEPKLRRAVAIARDLGASDPLEEALYALHLTLGGLDDKAERLAILDELRGNASAARDPVASVIAVLDVACDSLEVGNRDGANALRKEADLTAGTPPHPLTTWHRQVYDTGCALMRGEFAEVEELAREARGLGRRIGHPYADACYVGQISQLDMARGEMDRVVSFLEPALGGGDGPRQWVCARLARARWALGREEEARVLLSELVHEGFDAIPRNLRWIGTLVELAHCVADVEEMEAAESVVDLLAPFENHHSVLPMVVCYEGPVDFGLGRLYELLERPEEALGCYRSALTGAVGLGARPAEAQLRLALGRLMGRRGFRSEAKRELEAGTDLASELGMQTTV